MATGPGLFLHLWCRSDPRTLSPIKSKACPDAANADEWAEISAANGPCSKLLRMGLQRDIQDPCHMATRLYTRSLTLIQMALRSEADDIVETGSPSLLNSIVHAPRGRICTWRLEGLM